MYRLHIIADGDTFPISVSMENLSDIMEVIKKTIDDMGANALRTIYIRKEEEGKIWPRFNSRV